MADNPRPIDFTESSFKQSDVFDPTQDPYHATLANTIKNLNDGRLTPDLTKGVMFYKGLILSKEQKEEAFLEKWYGRAYSLFIDNPKPVKFFKVRIPELDSGILPLPEYYRRATIDLNNPAEVSRFAQAQTDINAHRTMRTFIFDDPINEKLDQGDLVWVFFNNNHTLTEPYIFSSIRPRGNSQVTANSNARPATPNPANQPTPFTGNAPSSGDGQSDRESPGTSSCSDIDNSLTTPVGCKRVNATGYKNGVATPIVLAELRDYPGLYLQVEPKNVWAPFHEMIDAAKRDGNTRIVINSTFRTMAKQKELYAKFENRTGNLAARPGYSNHQMGQVADINVADNPALLRWLFANANKYGFFKTVPSENWHWEYMK